MKHDLGLPRIAERLARSPFFLLSPQKFITTLGRHLLRGNMGSGILEDSFSSGKRQTQTYTAENRESRGEGVCIVGGSRAEYIHT